MMYEFDINPSNIWQQEMDYIDKNHTSTMSNERMDARLRAGEQIRHWSNNECIPYIKGGSLPNHLAKLLGYKSYNHLQHNHNERDSELLEALVGPHGFAIYKALEARNHEIES